MVIASEGVVFVVCISKAGCVGTDIFVSQFCFFLNYLRGKPPFYGDCIRNGNV